MTQYALDISLPVAYAPEQFVPSASNRLAYDWVTRWPDWPSHALYIYGEHGSGKTHLAHVWQRKSQAMFLEPNAIALPMQPAIVDGVERWQDEQALFHLLNHCMLQKIPLLMTATLPPDTLSITLPDVASRLKALPVAAIAPPDDALLEAVFHKHLADRQLKISPEVLHYMLPRLPRSLAELSQLVARLDNASLEAGRTLTIPFVRQACDW